MTKRSWTRLAASAAVSVALLGVGCDDDDQLSEGDCTTVPPAVSVPATTPDPAVTDSSPASPTTTPASAVPSPTSAEPVGSDTTVFEQGDIDKGLQPFIDMAIADLAGRLDVPPAEISAVSAVLVVWPDASLGCPRPDMQYAQVPTDGSVIELAAAGRVYRYHTGGSRGPFLCDQPLKSIPPAGD